MRRLREEMGAIRTPICEIEAGADETVRYEETSLEGCFANLQRRYIQLAYQLANGKD